jgi:lysozyme
MISYGFLVKAGIIATISALILGLGFAGCGGTSPMLNSTDGIGGRAGAGNEHFVRDHPNRYGIHGIDVSKWQGDIDWNQVRASGVKFAWIKATEGGDHADAKFQQNWDAAKAAGVPRGAYHFAYWCRTPAEQMAWFEKNVPYNPQALPPVLDVEATPKSKNCRRTLHRGPVLQEMREMLERMERYYRKRPVIYVTVDFYASIMHPNEFSDYPVWVRSTKYAPVVRFPGRRWVFWQYQSDGHVPGIRGKVDKNVFYGNNRDWVRWLKTGR